ncbi:MAG: thiopeptide-type bacteriocin biosynthesis protein [Ignavibacteria bacterium]|jgi:thiopeptide-type bacteriocin biosynthesis protein
MQKTGSDKKWESIHIFFKGDIYSYECDKIILELASPFIKTCFENKWIERYFFIRYSELGTHIRLRFFGKPENLNGEFKRCCNEFVINNLPEELIEFPIKKTLLNKDQKPEKESTPYLWIPYEPEVDRYGGEEAVKAAEDFFFYSSNTVIELLNKIKEGDKSSRLGFGLILFVVTIYSFFKELGNAKSFLKSYSEGYLKVRAREESEFKSWQDSFDKGFEKQSSKLIKYVSTIWEALETDSELGDPFDKFTSHCLEIKSAIKKLAGENKIIRYSKHINGVNNTLNNIVPSYIHMTNNRLGVSIPEESYLAHIILLAFNNSLITNKN